MKAQDGCSQAVGVTVGIGVGRWGWAPGCRGKGGGHSDLAWRASGGGAGRGPLASVWPGSVLCCLQAQPPAETEPVPKGTEGVPWARWGPRGTVRPLCPFVFASAASRPQSDESACISASWMRTRTRPGLLAGQPCSSGHGMARRVWHACDVPLGVAGPALEVLN